MTDYKALAQTIVDNVGGANNVRALTHCVTRLRFTLKNPKLTKTDVLEKTDGVIKVMHAQGQYQVVVGARSQASTTRSWQTLTSRVQARSSQHRQRQTEMRRTTP